MSDGAIPASTGRLLVFVGFRQPVIILQVSFSVASSVFAWSGRPGCGWSGSHFEFHSLRMMLFLYEKGGLERVI